MSNKQGPERTDDEENSGVSAEVHEDTENEIVLEPEFASGISVAGQVIYQRQLTKVPNELVSPKGLESVATTISTQMDAGTFRKLGVSFLIVQAMTLIGFSWYAWHIENSEVEGLVSGGLMLWFGLMAWKVAMPYPENTFLYCISIVLGCLSHNPLYMEPADQQQDIIYSLIAPVIALPVMNALGKGMRQISIDQEQLNDAALTSLQTSIKAGLAIIYLVAVGIGSIQGNSRQDIMDDIETVQQAEEGANSTEAMPYSSLHDLYSYMEAKETTDNFQDFRKAANGGFLLNLFLLQSFLFVHWARLSLLDVVQFRVTIAEGIEVAATIGFTIYILTYLALTVFPAKGPMFYSGMAMANAALISWVQISYSIFKGRHPYFDDRSRRLQNQNQKKEEQQRPEEIFPLTSEGP